MARRKMDLTPWVENPPVFGERERMVAVASHLQGAVTAVSTLQGW